MVEINGVAHVMLTVGEWEKSREFYGALLPFLGLSNVFAGLQLVFTDALRYDDVVVVEGEWGRIEELTLTYVVVHLWDERRLVLPATYFTTTPFENWTRTSSQLMQSVDFDLDWRVDPQAMRDEMHRILASPETKDKLTVLGLNPAPSSPDEMRGFLAREQERYAAIIKMANVKVE